MNKKALVTIISILAAIILLGLINYNTFPTHIAFASNSTDFDGDGFNSTIDCDDNNQSIYPGAIEACNEVDDNCDGLIDEENSAGCLIYYFDADQDSYGTNNTKCLCNPQMFYNATRNSDCDDNKYYINPGKTEIPFNGIDDDCNQTTFDKYNITLATDKANYQINDTVFIMLLAPMGSRVTITIRRGGEVLLNNTIPYEQSLTLWYTPSNDGNYSVEASVNYFNVINFTRANFYVKPNVIIPQFSVTLNWNQNITFAGDVVRFNATIKGGKIPYLIMWDYEDDGTIDLSNPTIANWSVVDKFYNTIGTHKMRVHVWDNENNNTNTLATFEVRSRTYLNINVQNETGNALIYARIIINDNDYYTDSEGFVKIPLSPATYNLYLTKDTYFTKRDTVTLDSNKSLSYTLQREEVDDDPPQINIENPANNEQIPPGIIRLLYRATDDSRFNCTLMISEDGKWWVTRETTIPAQESNEFILNDVLEDNSYYWRVICTDIKGHNRVSEERRFYVTSLNQDKSSENTISESGSQKQQTQTDENNKILTDPLKSEETTQALNQIKISMQAIENLEGLQLEAVQAIKLLDTLTRAEKRINILERDRYDLKYRRDLNDTQKAETRENYSQELTTMINSLPLSLTVQESTEYITYPTEAEISAALKAIMSVTNTTLKENDLNQYVTKIMNAQKSIVITTNVKIIQIQLYDGTTQTKTVIMRTIDPKGDLSNYSYYEYIPKTLVNSAQTIDLITTGTIIADDPVINFPIDAEKTIIYVIPTSITTEEVKGIIAFIATNPSLNTKQKGEKEKLTGFSIAGLVTIFPNSENSALVWQIGIIIILIIFYFLYHLGLFDRIFHRPQKAVKPKKQIEVEKILSETKEYLANGKREKAAFLYKELSLIYSSLPPNLKKELYPSLQDIGHQIDLKLFKELIDKIEPKLDTQDKQAIEELYNLIKIIYQKLPADYKKKAMEHGEKVFKKIGVL